MIQEMKKQLDLSCDQRQECQEVLKEVKDMIKLVGYNDKLVSLLVETERALVEIEYRIKDIQRHLDVLYNAKELSS